MVRFGPPAQPSRIRTCPTEKTMKMDRRLLFCLGVLAVLSAGPVRADGPPAARKDPVTDTYFGTTLTDDYRWLEDVKSTEVTGWIKAQADYTKATLDKIPGRDALYNDYIALDAKRPANINSVIRKSGRYFYKKT